MADISHIKVNNTTYDIKDYRVPNLTNSITAFLRGDGQWFVPVFDEGVTFVDNDDHLLVIIPGQGVIIWLI